MTPSILIPESPLEYVPESSPPWVWLGFIFVFAFLVLETFMVVFQLDEQQITAGLTLIAIAGFVYWLVCVHRFHKILAELTHGHYPISGAEAVGKHFIPFYNLYWVFNWPNVMSGYINERGRVHMMSGRLIGLFILLALLLRYLDGGVGLLMLFAVTIYVSAKLKQHVRVLKSGLPENLPPLPDPRIFGSPAETTSNPPARLPIEN
jgi:hypothetical protein